jgi:transposase
MDQKISRKPYSPEFRERAVRLFLEHRPEYASEVAALRALAEKLGCSPDSLRVWARQAQRDAGERPGQTSAEKTRIRELEREVRELRQANEILKKGEPLARHWSERQWRTHILRRRSSTARFANDRFH